MIFGIPLLINEMYKVDNGYITLWGATDVLSFYGTILSFLGTVGLGALVLCQNSRLMKLEETRFDLELQPFVTITNWKVLNVERYKELIYPKEISIEIENVLNEKDAIVKLVIYFTNTSNTFTIINYHGAKVFNNDLDDKKVYDEWNISYTNQQNTKLLLDIKETGKIVFFCKKTTLMNYMGKRITLELILENKLSHRYKATIDIIISTISETSDGWYIPLYPQNYRLGKFINDDSGNIVIKEIM